MRRNILSAAMESGNFSERPILSLEEEVIEAAEAGRAEVEASANQEEAERALEVVDALEDLAVTADSIEEATPTEVQLIQTAGDLATVGTEVPGDAVVGEGLESFKGGRISTEGIKATIASIWQQIKAVVKKIWKYIEEFFHKHFGIIPGLRKRVKVLRDRVGDNAGKKKENKFTVSSGVASLSVDFKPVKTGAELNTALATLSERLNDGLRGGQQSALAFGEKLAEAIGDLTPENAKTTAGNIIKEIKKQSGKPSKSKPTSVPAVVKGYEQFDNYVSDNLLGNVVIHSRVPNSSVETDKILISLELLRRSGSELKICRENGSVPSDFEFTVADNTTMIEILNHADSILQTIEEYERGKTSKDVKKVAERLESASERATKAFERLESTSNGDVKEAETTAAKAAVPYFRALLGFNVAYSGWIQKPAVQLVSNSMSVVRAVMALVEKNLAQYE